MNTIELGRRQVLGKGAGEDLEYLQQRWGRILVAGICFLIIGFFAVSLASLTTIVTLAIFGWFLVFAGIAQFVEAFAGRDRGGFVLELISAVLYLVAGFFLLRNPGLSAAMLTFMLAPLFIILGVVRSVTALTLRHAQWGWQMLSGVVSFMLGWFLLNRSPMTGLWLIGTFIGIELLFEGMALSSLALSLRKRKKSVKSKMAA